MRQRTRVGVLALALGAVLALGACSSNDSATDSTPTTAGGPEPVAVACKLVTNDDATKLFGAEASAAETASRGTESSVCMWQADDTDKRGYLLQIRVYDDEFSYGDKLFPKAVAVPGLGDKAFVNKGDDATGTDLQFVQDGKTYSVNYTITNGSAKPKRLPGDQVDELVAVVKANSSTG